MYDKPDGPGHVLTVLTLLGMGLFAGFLLWSEEEPPPCALGVCMGDFVDEEPDGETRDGLFFVVRDPAAFTEVEAYYIPGEVGVCGVMGTDSSGGGRERHVALVEQEFGPADHGHAVWADGLPSGVESVGVFEDSEGVKVMVRFDNWKECVDVGIRNSEAGHLP